LNTKLIGADVDMAALVGLVAVEVAFYGPLVVYKITLIHF
jgi:hypothetical protein